jgi:predicted  nucleic acid-binding Zn-ribbon protein
VANIFRKLYRRALDRELGVLGDELARISDQLDDVTERYHRIQSRVGMKELRAQRKGAAGSDEALLEELRAAAAQRGRPAKPNGGPEWPEMS